MILTTEQQSCKDTIGDYIQNRISTEGIIINGKAGTGKTTLLADIVNSIPSYMTVAIATLSHKAKGILVSKIGNKSNVEYFTLASLLNLSLDMETGEFTEDKDKKSKIDKFSIIIIDEASMLNKELLKVILKKKAWGAKLIFSLDFRQLPPIGEKESALYKNRKYKTIHLTKRVRQQAGNTILQYSDIYGDAVLNDDFNINPSRISDSNVIHYDNLKQCLEDYSEVIKESITTLNTSLIKILCYTNASKEKINKYIRETYIDEYAIWYIQKNDVLILNEPYYDLQNSEELVVLESECITEDGMLAYKVKVKSIFSGKISTILVLDEDSVAVHNKQCIQLWNQYTRNRKDKKLLTQYWEYRNKYAKVSHNFCTSVYKSQGSTYTNTIVLERDIMSTNIPIKQKLQAMYVAITRSSDKTIIVK